MTKRVLEIQANPLQIDLWPESVEQEIIQNINTLLLTAKYSVPLDRLFGLKAVFVDKPILVAQALIRSEVYEAIRKYEPRVKIESITFAQERNSGDASVRLSNLIPKVQVSIL